MRNFSHLTYPKVRGRPQGRSRNLLARYNVNFEIYNTQATHTKTSHYHVFRRSSTYTRIMLSFDVNFTNFLKVICWFNSTNRITYDFTTPMTFYERSKTFIHKMQWLLLPFEEQVRIFKTLKNLL